LWDLDPVVARSLNSILNYEGAPEDFEELFCLTFEVSGKLRDQVDQFTDGQY
jgi:hypothetical protein